MTLAQTILEYDAAYPGEEPATIEVPAGIWREWVMTAQHERADQKANEKLKRKADAAEKRFRGKR